MHVGEGALQQQIHIWCRGNDLCLCTRTRVLFRVQLVLKPLEEQAAWREKGAEKGKKGRDRWSVGAGKKDETQ